MNVVKNIFGFGRWIEMRLFTCFFPYFFHFKISMNLSQKFTTQTHFQMNIIQKEKRELVPVAIVVVCRFIDNFTSMSIWCLIVNLCIPTIYAVYLLKGPHHNHCRRCQSVKPNKDDIYAHTQTVFTLVSVEHWMNNFFFRDSSLLRSNNTNRFCYGR